MSDTPISPAAGAITLAGIALTLVAGTVTIRTPTIGTVALGSAAPAVVQQLQAPDTPTTTNLLNQDSKSGILKMWSPGGAGLFTVVGVWGGATASLVYAGPDGATMVAAGSATTLTANGCGTFNLPRGLIQAAITNASGTTSLTACAQELPSLIG
jgi:hypothetical protein